MSKGYSGLFLGTKGAAVKSSLSSSQVNFYVSSNGKVLDVIKYIDNNILSDETLTKGDRKLAMALKNKLIKALGEKKNEK